MVDEDVYLHAPTVTCPLLRAAASVIETASEQLPGEAVFFPPSEGEEVQPVKLEGDIPLADIAGLIHYLADMLEA